MTAVQLPTFFFEKSAIRPVWNDGEPWFVGRDVCAALEIKNESEALAKLDDDERLAGVDITDPNGPKRTGIIISEPGVYRLVFSSRKATAEKFKRWLSHEVLPAIRRTGRYEAARQAKATFRNDNRIRYAKMAIVAAVMRLEDLGVDAAVIDMATVVDFGRALGAIGGPR